ncbi:hypothetical protein K493DRAFT_303088 [Basidiobolus meristosporus CBS 931.73]|uniref:Pyrroline-5-carboxylate reductase catalytic N-terminal domain-containing protein n=1 Tax=Basidiobolus meristosporus CBS 931.73 TaxID=1314790 RepID=A0A1Y1Y449_9FUNG|nr:hypothetical protein K493DRAFT_303088 [Basidiobolus meristosporus CBS 931.73]|eukprot:ORX92802.1 hypothetical protein K493DRAFT_303088 [Basidiobolus meristosporus CBS 931.73]
MADISLESEPSCGADTNSKVKVSVIGTGWFGRAMCKRLLEAGYDVLLGTRKSTRATSSFELAVEPVSYAEAIQQTRVIILCLPQRAHLSFIKDYGTLLAGKILIDVTNPLHYHTGNDLNVSIAENLQAALPEAKVAKAFNTLSAYSLERHTRGTTQEVYICSNEPKTLHMVAELARELGYTPVDFGTLAMARTVETMPFTFFENWKVPLIICGGIHLFFFLYLLITRYVIQATPNYNTLPLFGFNSTVANTSLGLFALSNLAGHISGGIITGMAQAGLLAAHISALIYSILWIVSLPSVNSLLNWREWRFIQSKLGWTALALGYIHTVLMVYPFWKMVKDIPHIAMLGSILPGLAFVGKLLVLLPPVKAKLQRIHSGKP